MNASTPVLSRVASVTLAALSGACAGMAWSTPAPQVDLETQENGRAESDAAAEQAATERYIANLRSLLETQIVPALRQGIVATAVVHPRSLTVEVTEDPSPYNVGAKLEPDGSLKVRLTLGYTAMHAAALDAEMLSATLRRSSALRPYLTYQLLTARENYAHRAHAEPTRRALTFAEFADIDAAVLGSVYAQRDWRATRDRTEVESLGWVVAYLLTRADPKLAGALSFATSPEGAAAARLAAAADWFPVPPVATAFEWADVMRSPQRNWDGRALLCRAARFMESGVAALHVDERWRARLQQDEPLQRRLASIRSNIVDMRRDGGCPSTSRDVA